MELNKKQETITEEITTKVYKHREEPTSFGWLHYHALISSIVMVLLVIFKEPVIQFVIQIINQ